MRFKKAILFGAVLAAGATGLSCKKGGGGGGGAQNQQRPEQGSATKPSEHPNTGIDKRQAEQLLNSAEREERDVQARKQKENQPSPPPGGKDW